MSTVVIRTTVSIWSRWFPSFTPSVCHTSSLTKHTWKKITKVLTYNTVISNYVQSFTVNVSTLCRFLRVSMCHTVCSSCTVHSHCTKREGKTGWNFNFPFSLLSLVVSLFHSLGLPSGPATAYCWFLRRNGRQKPVSKLFFTFIS